MNLFLNRVRVLLVSCLLICLPVAGCKAAPKSPAQAQRVEQLESERALALAAGDTERASQIDDEIASIEQEAGETFFGQIFDGLAPFIPGLAFAKQLIVPLVATAALPRPREHYKNALGGIWQIFQALNPTNASVPPGQALAGLGRVVRGPLAAVGLMHTTDDPNEVIANGVALAKKKGVPIMPISPTTTPV
jgi:hypothetical protein